MLNLLVRLYMQGPAAAIIGDFARQQHEDVGIGIVLVRLGITKSALDYLSKDGLQILRDAGADPFPYNPELTERIENCNPQKEFLAAIYLKDKLVQLQTYRLREPQKGQAISSENN